MTMLGVTGTNGKTTITYLLKTVLEKTLGAKVGLIGTIQNMIGDTVIHTERTTPESFELQKLFCRDGATRAAHTVVMEVSSHALVLHRADEITFADRRFYEPDRRPSGFPQDDGRILRGEGDAFLKAASTAL